MDFRTIRYEQLGAVVRITANRPEVLNAQSRVMIRELDQAFRAASDDEETRAIIVAGAGKHFSAGHDLGTYGADARATGMKDRIQTRDQKFGDAGGGR